MDASEIHKHLSLLVAPGPLEKGGSQGRHQNDGWGGSRWGSEREKRNSSVRRGKAAPSSTIGPAVGEFLSVYVVGGGQVTCRIMGDQRRMRKI